MRKVFKGGNNSREEIIGNISWAFLSLHKEILKAQSMAPLQYVIHTAWTVKFVLNFYLLSLKGLTTPKLIKTGQVVCNHTIITF